MSQPIPVPTQDIDVRYECCGRWLVMQRARLVDEQVCCDLIIDGELYPWHEALDDPESALDVEDAGEFNLDALDAFWVSLNRVRRIPPLDLEESLNTFAAVTSATLRKTAKEQWDSVHADLLDMA
jgi:hypothetical protein